ncbi:MAG: hypothetical protein SCALA702_04090 [Melioribacteraceae bacterium]|nr:MAG: hypothetical protein SCALA702_04090 [Melioribacteraceae bacterium]
MKKYILMAILLISGCDDVLGPDEGDAQFYTYYTRGWDKFVFVIDNVSELDNLRLYGHIYRYSYRTSSSESYSYLISPVVVEFDATITQFPFSLEGYLESGEDAYYDNYAEIRMEYGDNTSENARFDIQMVYYDNALSTDTGEPIPVNQLTAYDINEEQVVFPEKFYFTREYGLKKY